MTDTGQLEKGTQHHRKLISKMNVYRFLLMLASVAAVACTDKGISQSDHDDSSGAASQYGVDGRNISNFDSMTPRERRWWIEALYELDVERDKLFQIIVQLGRDQEKDVVIKVFDDVLHAAPIEKEDFVVIGNLALKFDRSGRLIDLYEAIPGTTTRTEIVIKSSSDP